MNKKMRELQEKIQKHVDAAELYMSTATPDSEKAAAELDAADELQKQLDLEKRLEEKKRANLPTAVLNPAPEQSVNGYGILAKLLRGRQLTEAELNAVAASSEQQEKALISGTNAANGENYLCPEDIEHDIKEYRKSYKQARDLVTVEPTTALSGKCHYAANPTAGLVKFDDGDALDSASDPSFIPVPWTIEWYGALIPVSQILQEAEAANLRAYINKWFVRRAVITENSLIFNALRTGYDSGTPMAISGVAGMKSVVNKSLDPSCLIDGVIITNQSGFDCLDQEVDDSGRSVLQPDPTQPTRMLFKDVLPIEVFADAELENIDATHFPVFVGSIKAGCTMKEFQRMRLAVSSHFAFNKGQDVFRVQEGIAVVSTDKSAYVYGSLTAKPAKS